MSRLIVLPLFKIPKLYNIQGYYNGLNILTFLILITEQNKPQLHIAVHLMPNVMEIAADHFLHM